MILLVLPLLVTLDSAHSNEGTRSDEETFCVVSRQVKADCDTFDTDDSSEGYERAGFLTLGLKHQSKLLTFQYSRPASAQICLDHLQQIRALLKSSSRVCISGHGGNVSQKEPTFIWTRIESPLGLIER